MYFDEDTLICTLLSVHWMYFDEDTPIRTFLSTCCSRDSLDESMLLEVGEGTSVRMLDESIL